MTAIYNPMLTTLTPSDAALANEIAKQLMRIAERNDPAPTEVTVSARELVGFAQLLSLDVLHSEEVPKGMAVLTVGGRSTRICGVPR